MTADDDYWQDEEGLREDEAAVEVAIKRLRVAALGEDPDDPEACEAIATFGRWTIGQTAKALLRALALLTLLDATPSTRPVAVLSQSGEAARLREALGMPEKPGCRCPACVREP
jgi:hypothetical protein